jgi:DNA-binding response OmpR family regulator
LQYTNVTTAVDGRQALEQLQARDFDLVLLDVMMPELNGYEVLERMRADERLRHVPVVMISATDGVESVVRCIELGAEDYLPKPFDPVILRARIGACLEKKRLRDQEIRYLQDVARVTSAAAAVEADDFVAAMLTDVADRPDALGQLARVFLRMAGEVAAREAQLKQQIQVLKIEVDEVLKNRQVSEITETDYFQTLRQKARALRQRPQS